MKRIIFCALGLWACSSSVPSPSSSPASGEVCHVRASQTDGMGTMSWDRFFDNSGRYLRGEWSETYTGRGDETVRYDSQHRIISVRGYHYDPREDISKVFTADAEYDELGRLSELIIENPHFYRSGKRRRRFEYDAEGRLIKIRRRIKMTSTYTEFFYEEDRIRSITETGHDVDRRAWTVQGEFTYEEDGTVHYHFQRCWDRSERCTEEEHWFAHDAAGRLTGWNRSGGHHQYRFSYGPSNKLVTKLLIRGKAQDPTDFTYDSEKRLVNSLGQIKRTYEYEGACPEAMLQPSVSTPLGFLGYEPCIPTRVLGCVSPDSLRVLKW